MRVLTILAHPLPGSLSHRFADRLQRDLTARRHDSVLHDLYAEGFDPRLTAEERRGWYDTPFEDRVSLQTAEGLVLVFPTWWFGLPAILKGWIDRSFLPGVAFDHDPARGTIEPALPALRAVLAITTLGSPALYDHLVMRQPVRRMLKHGLIRACAPRARFDMLSLYRAESMTDMRLKGFEAKLDRAAQHLFPTES